MMLYIEAPRYEFAIVVKLKQGNCTGRCSWNKIKKKWGCSIHYFIMYTKGTPDNNAFSPFQYYLKDTSSKLASVAGWSINKVSELGV